MNGNEVPLAIIIILALAAYVQAYNWGWSNGHDVHHTEPNNGPRNEPPKPEPPTTIWR